MNTRRSGRRSRVKDHPPKKGSNNGVKRKQKNRQKSSKDEPKDSIEKMDDIDTSAEEEKKNLAEMEAIIVNLEEENKDLLGNIKKFEDEMEECFGILSYTLSKYGETVPVEEHDKPMDYVKKIVSMIEVFKGKSDHYEEEVTNYKKISEEKQAAIDTIMKRPKKKCRKNQNQKKT